MSDVGTDTAYGFPSEKQQTNANDGDCCRHAVHTRTLVRLVVVEEVEVGRDACVVRRRHELVSVLLLQLLLLLLEGLEGDGGHAVAGLLLVLLTDRLLQCGGSSDELGVEFHLLLPASVRRLRRRLRGCHHVADGTRR